MKDLLQTRMMELRRNGWTISHQMMKKYDRLVTFYALANMSDESFKKLLEEDEI